ncbi:AAA family ATPase [Aquabacterium parvum]|uniref:AAA family ATPase n=1 Tax=Aquabacterium parvum TaxID=70584 RepID=UPI000718C1F1|nr:AAA family ATPase [Aquabacterium parvum]
MAKLGRLQHIKLEGFRSIRKLDLELAPLNILIGPNGAGKSNFISFFKFMNKLLQKDLQLHIQQLGGADRVLHFGRKTTELLSIDLHFSPNGYEAELVPTQEGRLIFRSEHALFFGNEAGYYGGTKRRTLAKAGSDESALPDPGNSSPQSFVARYLSDWKVYHFHDTSDSAKVKGSYSIYASERLMPQGENLAAFLYAIKGSPAYARIVSTIQRVAPFFQDFIFQVEPNDLIRLRWKHKGSDDYFDATMLSDGTLRFICLTTLLLQPELPTILLLDEPELGLHPFAVQLLAAMMRSASHSTQIIASTQSVTLANEFGWEDLVVVDQKNNESLFRRLKEDEVKAWLDDYKVGDLWEKNVLGGTPE